MELQVFLKSLTNWAAAQSEIGAVAYVGSHARGTATSKSDLDIMILTRDPQKLLQSSDWLRTFGQIIKIQREDWGAVQTWRGWYEEGNEIEFNVADLNWANIHPIDPGTWNVVKEGLEIIWDPQNLLSNLKEKVTRAGK